LEKTFEFDQHLIISCGQEHLCFTSFAELVYSACFASRCFYVAADFDQKMVGKIRYSSNCYYMHHMRPMIPDKVYFVFHEWQS